MFCLSLWEHGGVFRKCERLEIGGWQQLRIKLLLSCVKEWLSVETRNRVAVWHICSPSHDKTCVMFALTQTQTLQRTPHRIMFHHKTRQRCVTCAYNTLARKYHKLFPHFTTLLSASHTKHARSFNGAGSKHAHRLTGLKLWLTMYKWIALTIALPKGRKIWSYFRVILRMPFLNYFELQKVQ